ncbi:hypothetical protein [Falsihalocynthiibacter arcticus]|uniref:Uncharacterized protein n=1 Tax=Falsihalocynthiibacter arcticus TaxID=1579316 RepID=A0A126V044_9RHOB|nr:hypothetical protein [Falsihalocynthiibacter arcticus]AML51069.1 hypothetical protein RC74_07095 [Falsihalocynthiibacter arcticus]
MDQKLGVCLTSCGVLLGTMAQADCPVGQEAFTSCQIEGRNTEVFVCFDDQVATYRYGPIGGTPDLLLSDTVTHVDFEAWSGLGKAISETVTFYNGDFSYEVGGGFDRPFSEEEMELGPRRFGWIDVAQDGQSLSRLECIPDTVGYGWGGGIYDAKVVAGLVWDDYSKTWMGDVVTQTPILLSDDEGGCLVGPEFRLGGVAMGDPVATLHKLGSPEVSGVFLPDGREIDRVTAMGMDIDILNNLVIGMTATDQIWDMPSGLRVGLTRGEVIAILGRVPGGARPDADVFNAIVCSEAPQDVANWYAAIAFGPDKRVQSIKFISLAP